MRSKNFLVFDENKNLTSKIQDEVAFSAIFWSLKNVAGKSEKLKMALLMIKIAKITKMSKNCKNADFRHFRFWTPIYNLEIAPFFTFLSKSRFLLILRFGFFDVLTKFFLSKMPLFRENLVRFATGNIDILIFPVANRTSCCLGKMKKDKKSRELVAFSDRPSPKVEEQICGLRSEGRGPK